jgi:uncharacterized protein
MWQQRVQSASVRTIQSSCGLVVSTWQFRRKFAMMLVDSFEMVIRNTSIARISAAQTLLLAAVIGVVLAGAVAWWATHAQPGHAFDWNAFFLAFAIGLFAQLVDGALGMAYGITANTMLLASGLSPVAATSTVHVAEAFTTAASGLSHWRLGNIDKRIFNRIVIPGVIGGVAGVLLITSIDGKILRPWISGYLLLIGLFIIYRAFFEVRWSGLQGKRLIPLAFTGGFADSVGGGGWGPVVTTTLLASGHEPRTTVGSVNAAEFFVTLASGFSFALLVGIQTWESVAGLIIGGLVMAPFAARLTSRIDRKLMLVFVGLLISGLSLWTVLRALGF